MYRKKSLHRRVKLLPQFTLTNKKTTHLHKITYKIQNIHIMNIVQVSLEGFK